MFRLLSDENKNNFTIGQHQILKKSYTYIYTLEKEIYTLKLNNPEKIEEINNKMNELNKINDNINFLLDFLDN